MHETQHGSILLVDDDEHIRRDYARLLSGIGYSVKVASDGKEALELVPQERFDVIVSDIAMPSLGGLDFLRAVRELDLLVPVVLITGQPGLDSAIKAVEYGAASYLVKPVNADTLAATVRRAASMHRLLELRREAWEVAGAGGLQLSDRAGLDARFDRALDGMFVAYQPIVRWNSRTVFAYEALVRSNEPSLPSPGDLFDAADRLGRTQDLGRRIRATVATDARAAPEGVMLFVNVNAEELNDNEISSASSPLVEIADRVVLEITERSALDRVTGLSTRMARLRRCGFRIAVDDLGAGYAGLSSFSLLEPEFAKLDMSMIRGVDTSSRKRSVVRRITQLCARDLGIEVIAEGVETAAERDALAGSDGVGLDLLQGYLFAKPQAGFSAPEY